jgi:4'-phosphopantetheinyl transferase
VIPDYPEVTCQAFVLPRGSVDVWTLSLDRIVGEADWNILESSECARANRFRKQTDRNRYVVCRSALRRILGNYIDCAPECLVFEYGKNGKPSLVGEPLHFNVSHADGKCLIAATDAAPVGVDLEPETRALSVSEFAKTLCSPSEHAYILALPTADQGRELLRIWVAKEAFLKSLGEGLSTRPLSFIDARELPVCFIDPIPGFVSALSLAPYSD